MKTNGKVKMLFGGVVCALTLAAASLAVAPVHAQAATKTAICPQNRALTLADRSKIQLDPGEWWADGSEFTHCAFFDDGDDLIACNNGCGHDNTLRNHFGLHRRPQLDPALNGSGKAWAFTCVWQEDKKAFTIQTAMPWSDGGHPSFTNCTFKYWNLSGKNTKNHTRIQTWTGGAKKAENLFWVSAKGYGDIVRIWSALAGRPVGYTSDRNNLRTLDVNEPNTKQFFTARHIDYDLIEAISNRPMF